MIRPVRHDSDRRQSVDARLRRLLLRVSPVSRVRERIAAVYHASAWSANEDPHADGTITVKDGVIAVKNRSCPRRTSLLRFVAGDRVDFDSCVAWQTRRLHRHTCRLRIPEVRRIHFVHGSEIIHVRQEYRRADDMIE